MRYNEGNFNFGGLFMAIDPSTLDLTVQRLGKPRFNSPLQLSSIDGDYIANFVDDSARILYHNRLNSVLQTVQVGKELVSFEAAGPRKQIFFNATDVTAAIVTCGGLCPGINDVIRGLVHSLYYSYGVNHILGIHYGFKGLVEKSMLNPIELTPKVVEDIANQGGTFLGSSRGPQEPSAMVDYMVRNKINMLFTIGGDGTQRGAMAIAEEVKRRELDIAVIGIPKTIDNDISLVERSFGFNTAFAVASEVLMSAHAEAEGAYNGIAIVKLMGRQSGFLTCTAALATGEVNFILIPEVPFDLDPPNGFLPELEKRLLQRHHALIVVAEGAGQEFIQAEADGLGTDASGNQKLADIGVYLKSKVTDYFNEREIEARVRYIDPSYYVRSVPAIPSDRMYCLQLAHNAVHAAMSGRTSMLVGYWNGTITHIPIHAAVSERKVVDPESDLWLSVLQSSGQARWMKNS